MSEPLIFNPHEWIVLNAQGRFEELSEKWLVILRQLESARISSVDATTQLAINAFVLNFLPLFCQAEYSTGKYSRDFVRQNLTIANLTALSALRTTDSYLELVRHQRESLPKVLTLFSARNSLHFNRREFFDADHQLASCWYYAFANIYHSGLLLAHVSANLAEHFAYTDSRLQPVPEISPAYYGCSYLMGDSERRIKPAVNAAFRTLMSRHEVHNDPQPRKIAVVSASWVPQHAVYRCFSAFVEALRDYDLTLVTWSKSEQVMDTGLFREVKRLEFDHGLLDVRPLLQNNFALAYFPDVGMNAPSVTLANLRFAPIQIASHGHSVSTWGADIDYFISGADVESADRPEQHYSERLVLLPGSGVVHNRPLYEPTGNRQKSVPEFVLNCPWSSQKINHRFLAVLQELVRCSRKPLRFRVGVGSSLKWQMDLAPFTRDLAGLLAPAAVEIQPHLGYAGYMAWLEEGDLTIESYHYGGCNTVADSLFVGIPIVTYQGDRWYNRIGSQMLRQTGLDELVALDEQEYLALVLRLIHNDAYREKIASRVRAADLDGTIFSRADAGYFRTAVDYLIAHHHRLRHEADRTPIRIPRVTTGLPPRSGDRR